MPNYYWELSIRLPFTREQAAWTIALHETMTTKTPVADAPIELREAMAGELQDYTGEDLEACVYVEADPDHSLPAGLWIHSQVTDTNYAALLIFETLKHFAIERPVALCWAEYVDKPVPGEFGGGAYIISRTAIESSIDVRSWARDELAQRGYPEEDNNGA